MSHVASLLGFAVALALPAAAHAQAGGAAAKSTPKVLDRHLPGSGIKSATVRSGRIGGDAYLQGWIEAGAELKLEQQFLAGQPAAVTLRTAAPAPLGVTVAEPGEQPVCRGAPRGCRWRPLFTQRYAITLRNAGGVRVRYLLMVE